MKFKNLFKQPVPSKDWLYIRDIVKKYLADPEVSKLISPEANEYFLISESKQVSILVEDGKVSISNHSFLYRETFEYKLTNILIKEIRAQIKKERDALKEKLFQDNIQLLQKLYKS